MITATWALAGAIALAPIILGFFTLLRNTNRENASDNREEAERCFEERRSLKERNRHLEQQVFDLMLDHMEKGGKA